MSISTQTEPGRVTTASSRRIVQWYKATAILLLNTIVLFVMVNLVLLVPIVVWHWMTDPPDPVSGKYAEQNLRKVYARMTDEEREQLLFETWNRPLLFEQFVQLKERPFSGKYVNVSEAGYRFSPPQGPWPLDSGNYNVFVFGGSTTFGYGVADDQTVPTNLQGALSAAGYAGKRVCVYNFGRAFYYSTPERILLEQLLLGGARPDMAVFIDGINDFYYADDVFNRTRELSKAVTPLSDNQRIGKNALEILQH